MERMNATVYTPAVAEGGGEYRIIHIHPGDIEVQQYSETSGGWDHAAWIVPIHGRTAQQQGMAWIAYRNSENRKDV